MAIRTSSKDADYFTGQLSFYPITLDDNNQLYKATNNSVSSLKQSLTLVGKYIILEDASTFPESGILRIGAPPGESGASEMVYYQSKSGVIIKDLIRGFAGSKSTVWPTGSIVSHAVFAEHHNSIKDAILQIEHNLGEKFLPITDSLNQILQSQETKFLSPKALFRSFPTRGSPPFSVRFQNFSTGQIVRSLWDFGDGTTSVEKSPIHTYYNEGIYTVKLNIITSLGAQGYSTKSNYITVDKEIKQPFFYAVPLFGVSQQTADRNHISPTTFEFVDQSDGAILERWWNVDGANTTINVKNPNTHTISYIFPIPGEYNPSLLVLLESLALKKAYINPYNTKGLGIIVT